MKKLIDKLAELEPDKRVIFFKEKVLNQFPYERPLNRDVFIDECSKLLKACGVTKASIREEVKAIMPEDELGAHDGKEERKTQADLLIEMAGKATLFHDDLQDCFARVEVDGYAETWPTRSRFFRRWLVGRFYTETGKAPNNDAIGQAMGVIEAKATFDSPEHKLELRVAEHGGAFWYDLADPAWRAVKVTGEGWEVVDRPPILFRRYKNTSIQPEPKRVKDGLWKLLDFVNLPDEKEQYLLLIYVVTCLVPKIPHVIPVFHGEKGAAKSTAMRVLRRLIDPAVQELLTLPKDQNELALQFSHNYMPGFDNLDSLQTWQSDMLCQAATGGGISKREHYTNDDEIILSFLRCPALNGINLVATRPDLLDRSLLFGLERVDPGTRRPEAEFWQEFEQARPGIVGGMFEALASAMRIYPDVKLDRLPRMADFCRWGYAVSQGLGIGGKVFLDAYLGNIGGANEEAISGNPVAAAVAAMMQGRRYWEGTPAGLLDTLQKVAESERINTRAKSWPKAANTLTRRLLQVKSNLMDAGIEYGHDGHTRTGAKIVFRKVSESIVTTVTSSQTQEYQGFQRDDTRDDTEAQKSIVTVSSHEKPSNGAACDGCDDCDDTFGTYRKEVNAQNQPVKDNTVSACQKSQPAGRFQHPRQVCVQ